MKKILILTASFGEGHNSAARGLRAGLERVGGENVEVELHDIFNETYGQLSRWTRDAYFALINNKPQTWAQIYRWMDRKKEFTGNFRIFFVARWLLKRVIARFQPDVIVSVYPAYSHILDDLLGPTETHPSKRVVVITDSLTINAIWYRCSADFFIVPNEQTAAIVHAAGVPLEKIRTFGFPVSLKFVELCAARPPLSPELPRRVLFMVSAGKGNAPELARRLAALPNIQLTVSVAREKGLQRVMEEVRETVERRFEIVSWTDELPGILRATHLLVTKAGGATVQEAIAAGCPMIVNRIVPGQEEGNARLVAQTGSGMIAMSHDEVIAAVESAFTNNAAQLLEWVGNIAKLSRPTAAIEIGKFLLSL